MGIIFWYIIRSLIGIKSLLYLCNWIKQGVIVPGEKKNYEDIVEI